MSTLEHLVALLARRSVRGLLPWVFAISHWESPVFAPGSDANLQASGPVVTVVGPAVGIGGLLHWSLAFMAVRSRAWNSARSKQRWAGATKTGPHPGPFRRAPGKEPRGPVIVFAVRWGLWSKQRDRLRVWLLRWVAHNVGTSDRLTTVDAGGLCSRFRRMLDGELRGEGRIRWHIDVGVQRHCAGVRESEARARPRIVFDSNRIHAVSLSRD